MSSLRSIVLAATTALLLLAFATESQANAFRVDVVLAQDQDEFVDPKLSALSERLLTQFPRFTSFRHHEKHDLELPVGDSAEIGVDGRHILKLTHLSHESTVHRVAIELPGGSSEISLPAGRRIFIGGPTALDSTLIFLLQAPDAD